MGELNRRITNLENQAEQTRIELENLSIETEQREAKPYSTVGGSQSNSFIHPLDIRSGFSQVYGGSIPWNACDLKNFPYGSPGLPPTDGTPCYNLHSHSRYTGGALIVGVTEAVEYDWGKITNKYAPQLWNPFPNPKLVLNSKGEATAKIGTIDLVFNPDTKTWGTVAYEIDVKKCYFVLRDEKGEIKKDKNGVEMKSPLYNEDPNLSSIIWDEAGKVWRLLAVYAPGN